MVPACLCDAAVCCDKAVSVALRQWPDVNGSLSADGSALLRHPSHNLGVAMATPSGLVVRLLLTANRRQAAARSAMQCEVIWK